MKTSGVTRSFINCLNNNHNHNHNNNVITRAQRLGGTTLIPSSLAPPTRISYLTSSPTDNFNSKRSISISVDDPSTTRRIQHPLDPNRETTDGNGNFRASDNNKNNNNNGGITGRTGSSSLNPVVHGSQQQQQQQHGGPKAAGPHARSAPVPSPSPSGDEPSLGKSELLLDTTEKALATPGLRFTDGHGLKGPTGKGRKTRRLNLYQAIRDALGTELATNPRAVVFGEDVAFGGVFRCTMGLTEEFGKKRVFNTPLTEQGIAGFGIGLASVGASAIGEIQFGDYIFPAFDQIVNEAAKQRYASGGGYPLPGGSLTLRAPIGSVGHGGLYHSQSPEGFFMGAAGVKVVIPRSPIQAKGLLLAAIRDPNPVLVFEPKILYRAAVEQVPEDDYTLPLGEIDIIQQGTDLTLVSYGTPLYTCLRAISLLTSPPPSLIPFLPPHLRPPNPAPSIQLIDIRTINPLPSNQIAEQVKQTGRCVIVHEAGKSGGVGNNIASEVGRRSFEWLEAPVGLCTGWDTPVPLTFEKFYQPDVIRMFDKIVETLSY